MYLFSIYNKRVLEIGHKNRFNLTKEPIDSVQHEREVCQAKELSAHIVRNNYEDILK
jgi:hypothetical protein